jgi:hypothetical protein
MSKLPKSATLSEVIEEARNQSPVERVESWREEGIRARVLAALGRPAALVRVTVQSLWGDNFRVNVWVGVESGNAILNSYFVTADERGTILKSEPPVEKQH